VRYAQGTRVPAPPEENTQGHQGWQYPAQHRGPRKAGGLWRRRTAYGMRNAATHFL
jgi:hypothetical protein